MDELIKKYEEFIRRLEISEVWLEKNGYNDWEEVKKYSPETYQRRQNIILWIERLKVDIHEKLGLNQPWNRYK